ncbi:MAG: FtsQ-type POTRA domain-containing protein [Deltaproteobacteria bacterium]|nr:FtsQ-type POTRA domain-containing protein [Deltaproteobacteria bacterium]
MFGRGNRRIMTFRQRVEAVRYAAVHTGRQAWSGARRWWKAAAATTGAVALVAGGVTAWQALRDSDHFLLRTLDVDGAVRLPVEEVAALCGLEVGVTNVLFESASGVAARCEADPRIRRAEVDFQPPDAAAVRVEEQAPVLYAAAGDGLWAVNAYAEAYAPADAMELPELPLVVAARRGEALPMTEGVLRQALALVRTVSAPASPWAGQGVLVTWDPDLGFGVSAAGRGLRARFGEAPFPRKLDRLVAALDVAADRLMVVEEARLDNGVRPNEVTLRLAPAGGALAPLY